MSYLVNSNNQLDNLDGQSSIGLYEQQLVQRRVILRKKHKKRYL